MSKKDFKKKIKVDTNKTGRIYKIYATGSGNPLEINKYSRRQ